MANGFSVIGTQDTNVLISAINQELNTMMNAADATYRRICKVDSTSNAKFQHYPMHVTGYATRERLAYQLAEFSKPQIIDVVVQGTDFETPIEMQSLGQFDDPYGLIKDASQDALKSATRQWEIILAQLINSNGNAYDGLPFFGTHSTNASVVGRTDFSNVLVNTPPNKAGFIRGFNALQNRIGFDGRRLFPDLDQTREVICVVPTFEAYVSLLEVINAGLTAEPVGASAAGSTDTRLVSYAKNVIILPELNDPAVPGSSNNWYMVATGYSTRPAFIMRDYKQPQFHYIAPNQWLDNQYMAQGFTVRSAGGAGFGLPQSVVRCQF